MNWRLWTWDLISSRLLSRQRRCQWRSNHDFAADIMHRQSFEEPPKPSLYLRSRLAYRCLLTGRYGLLERLPATPFPSSHNYIQGDEMILHAIQALTHRGFGLDGVGGAEMSWSSFTTYPRAI